MKTLIHNTAAIAASVLLAAALCAGGCDRGASEPDTATLIEQLGSSDQDTHIKAAWSLAKLKADAIAPLAGALRSTDRTLARRASEVLMTIGAPSAKALKEALADTNYPWPEAAARALAMIEPPSQAVIDTLLGSLKNGDAEARAMSADTLGRITIEADKILPALLNALRDSDTNVCQAATWSLVAIGKPAIEPLISAMSDSRIKHRRHVALALSKVGPAAGKAAAPLVEMLKTGDENHRGLAIHVLRRIGPDPAIVIDPLIAAFNDPNETISQAASQVLGELGAPAVDALTNALSDKKNTRPGHAAIALSRIGYQAAKAVDPLIVLLKNGDEAARGQAAFALSKVAPLEAKIVSALVAALQTDPAEYSVRMYAAEALGRLRPPATAAIPALTEAMKHTHRAVRQAASEAIEDIKNPPPLQTHDHSKCDHPGHTH
jgi:HEAT repeat protein